MELSLPEAFPDVSLSGFLREGSGSSATLQVPSLTETLFIKRDGADVGVLGLVLVSRGSAGWERIRHETERVGRCKRKPVAFAWESRSEADPV